MSKMRDRDRIGNTLKTNLKRIQNEFKKNKSLKRKGKREIKVQIEKGNNSTNTKTCPNLLSIFGRS